MKVSYKRYTVPSIYGHFIMVLDEEHSIVEILFPGKKNTRKPLPKLKHGKTPKSVIAFQNYLSGKKVSFRAIKFKHQFKTIFEKRVFQELGKIPFGKCITYGDLAKRAGYPGAARAVGSVMRKNDIPILRPCHRVVSSGGFGGYSQGLIWKKRLWDLEKIKTRKFSVST